MNIIQYATKVFHLTSKYFTKKNVFLENTRLYSAECKTSPRNAMRSYLTRLEGCVLILWITLTYRSSKRSIDPPLPSGQPPVDAPDKMFYLVCYLKVYQQSFINIWHQLKLPFLKSSEVCSNYWEFATQ